MVDNPNLLTRSSDVPNIYTTEIQKMMYGFGDISSPDIESAKLIEKIVHSQMRTLLIRTAELACIKQRKYIDTDDILFVLRKNKSKLARLIKYMAAKELKNFVESEVASTENNKQGNAFNPEHVEGPKKKRVCRSFLESIDQTGELVNICDRVELGDDTLDETKKERDKRTELISRNMSLDKYLEWAEARRASFAKRQNIKVFQEWLFNNIEMEQKLSPGALDLFQHMATETVAEIVDMALLIKKEKKEISDQQFSLNMPTRCVNKDFPSVQLFQNGGTSGLASPSRTSPPPSPSSSTNSDSHSSLTSGISWFHNTTIKPSHKKAQAIKPGEIHEAIRRYTNANNPMAAFSRNYTIPFYEKLIAA